MTTCPCGQPVGPRARRYCTPTCRPRTERTALTDDTLMRHLRATAGVLQARGLCGKWIPGQPTLCALTAGHPLTCGTYYAMREAA